MKEYILNATGGHQVLIFLVVVYGLVHGFRYVGIVWATALSGRKYSTDILTVSLQWSWYAAIVYLWLNS